MATLENIRKRGPLVAVIIGFAMFAFILGDLLNSGSSLFSGDQFRIAQIDDVSVNYQEYEQKVMEATELYKQRMNIPSVDERLKEEIKRQVWEDMVQGIIMGAEYEELGITVSSDELFDLVQGKNIDPMIRQIPIFTNQQTGIFDPSLVVRFLKTMDQDQSGNSKATWIALEGEILQNQLSRKYMNLILKGLYLPNKQVENEFTDRNYIVDFDFVSSKFSEIADSTINISDADIKEYYDNHEKDFEQEASRDVAYVTYTVEPSTKDTLYTQEWINKIFEEYTTTDNNKQFINFNSDVAIDEKHYKKGEYTNIDVDSILFDSEINTIYGPYQEDGSYKLAKLLEIKNLPDSLEVKHILIQPDGKTIVDVNRAKTIADSLKNVIKNGVSFAEIAKNYSADKKSGEEGGEMGWFVEGQAAAPFQIQPFDLLVDSTLNKLITLEYNYGVHLISVTKKGPEFKKIKIGVVERKIIASSETYQIVYSQASKFAGENRKLVKFEKTIDENKLIKKIAPGITQNETFIAGLQSPREMIRWAFKSEKNDVSDVFEFSNNYVVAALTEIREKGTAPIEQVKEEIKFLVSKEKKIALLKEKMAKLLPSDLETLASKLSQDVKESRNISFTSFQIPGMGYEPNVIANAVSLEKDKISAPIEGENGVYVIQVKSITPAPSVESMNIIAEKTKLTRDIQQRTLQQIYKALKNSSEITDERSKFY